MKAYHACAFGIFFLTGPRGIHLELMGAPLAPRQCRILKLPCTVIAASIDETPCGPRVREIIQVELTTYGRPLVLNQTPDAFLR